MLSELKKQGLESLNLTSSRSIPHLAEAVLHEPGDGEPVVSEVLRAATPGRARSCDRRWSRSAADDARRTVQRVEGGDERWQRNVSGTRRTTTRCSASATTPTAKDITKAYRKLARDSHPDTHPGDDAAEERFKEVSAAYDVLGDEAKRKEYDEVRRLGPDRRVPGRRPGGPAGYNFNVGSDGLGDLLGQMFGRGRRGGGPSAAAGPQRGADVEATLTLDFADAVKGLTTTLYLTSDAQCTTCHGSGAKPGTQPEGVLAVRRSRCGRRQPGLVLVLLAVPCLRRPRRGHRPIRARRAAAPASSGGRARCRRASPPASPTARGSASRAAVRPGRNGGPAGDLIVECHVAPHRLFGRDGNNLTVKVPVTFAEAALGGDIDVPTLDGPRVTLRLRPGTPSGSRHRVKGKGIVTNEGDGRPDRHRRGRRARRTSPTSSARPSRHLAAATTVSPRTRLES